MPPAGDRVIGRCREGQEHFLHDFTVPGLTRPLDLEGGITIVQEGHVSDAEGCGNGGISFVAGGTDRVESLATRLKFAGMPVKMARQNLAVEQALQIVCGQAAFPQGNAGMVQRKIPRRDASEEVFMNDFSTIRHSSESDFQALESGSEEGLKPCLGPPEDKRMHIMRAFIGVDRFQVHHVAHDLVFFLDAIAAMHVA